MEVAGGGPHAYPPLDVLAVYAGDLVRGGGGAGEYKQTSKRSRCRSRERETRPLPAPVAAAKACQRRGGRLAVAAAPRLPPGTSAAATAAATVPTQR